MGSYKDEEMGIYGIKYLYLQDIEHLVDLSLEDIT